MKFDRRRFLGAVAMGTAGLAVRPARTMPLAIAGPIAATHSTLQERAQAALATHGPLIGQRDVVGMVDFTMPSRAPRFHLLDMGSGAISTHLVAHGRGSDPANSGWAERFSNLPGSEATSRGGFLTCEWYNGKYGTSIRLVGLDRDNSLALNRAIVVHPAWYADPSMIAKWGKLGRSEGCFAMAPGDFNEALWHLSGGRLLYADRISLV